MKAKGGDMRVKSDGNQVERGCSAGHPQLSVVTPKKKLFKKIKVKITPGMYFLGFSLSLFALELALGCKKRWSSKVISIKADSSGGAGNPEFSVVAPGKDFCLGFQVVPK